MSKNTQSRRQLAQKLSKKLAVATPLVVAAFGMSQVATAQSSNCPPGSTYTGGICLASSTYKAPNYQTTTYSAQPEATGEAEATGSAYKPAGEAEAQPEATGEAEATGSAYKPAGEAEATGSAYKAKGEAEATGSAYKAKGEAEATGSAYKAKGEAEGGN